MSSLEEGAVVCEREEAGPFVYATLLRSTMESPPFRMILETSETKGGQGPMRKFESDFTWIKAHRICKLRQFS
jgi:hypothetical protein